jgi:S-formylglutathione hydrolase FrmB
MGVALLAWRPPWPNGVSYIRKSAADKSRAPAPCQATAPAGRVTRACLYATRRANLCDMIASLLRRVACGALLASLLLAHAARLASAAVTLPLMDGFGIHIEAVESITPRQLHYRVSTAALQQPVDLRILLPADYAERTTPYPVLYLFHGTSGRASDWVSAGDAEATTAGLPVIVVMPDCGFNGDGGGWFSDWFNFGAFGPPMWETFHVTQLIPWVDLNFRTVAGRDGRAVAGLSQGGFGSLSYAARHPDLFTSAAAFSGGCQIDRDQEAIDTSTAIIMFTTGVLSGKDPNAIFGPRATYPLNWRAHDPASLVTNLRGMDIQLWTGDGAQGPLDPGPPTAPLDPIEVVTFGATRLFHGHLDQSRIPHGYFYYGAGTHTWPYWARDLREYMPLLMARFDAAPPPPRTVNYASYDDLYQAWGWRVALQRDARDLSQLRYATRNGFTLTGTGVAAVRTAPLFAPGERVRVRLRGYQVRSAAVAEADSAGRLLISVPLSDGPRARTTRVSLQPR